MDGILNLNKPSGMTSFQVVGMVRRLSRERRVGHSGTLDPLASGVLITGVGKGTRALEFIAGTKVYRASLVLGKTTDTYDAEGRVTAVSDPSGIILSRVEEALSAFVGEIDQAPPAYSAIKQGGNRLYAMARAGLEVAAPPRRVTVHRAVVVGWDLPVLGIEVECGKGTYIRSIAHDLGQALGCGAYLQGLQRIKDGPFSIEDATPLDELERKMQTEGWDSIMLPVDAVMGSLRPLVLKDFSIKTAVNGGAITADCLESETRAAAGEKFRAYSNNGEFLAVMEYDAGSSAWRPVKVFAAPA